MKISRDEKTANVIEYLCRDIEVLCDTIEHLHPGEHTFVLEDFRRHTKEARVNGAIRGLVLTTAPQCYDYDYVIEVNANYGTFMGKTVRLVAIPYKSIDYQCGRYSSGLYLAVSEQRGEDIGVKRSAEGEVSCGERSSTSD